MIIDDDANEGNDSAQSDLVRLALNLAYMPESKAKTFTFSVDGFMKYQGGDKPINTIQ